MKVIYYCYGGSHSSVTAAAIHLGLLKERPSYHQLLDIPYFDYQTKYQHGIIRCLGVDGNGTEVFFVGRRNYKAFEQLVLSIADLLGTPRSELILVNTLPCTNWLMVIGGLLSRGLGLVSLGRPIVAWGTIMAFPRFTSLVKEVKGLVSVHLSCKESRPNE